MGPSRSQQSSTQIVNGNVTSTSSITFTYILMANNAGEYTIPGASIVADGDQMVSNSVKIKVLPQDQGGKDVYKRQTMYRMAQLLKYQNLQKNK